MFLYSPFSRSIGYPLSPASLIASSSFFAFTSVVRFLTLTLDLAIARLSDPSRMPVSSSISLR